MTDPLPPIPTPLPPPDRVLAIGAHPDDIEFGCGGTLAKWAATGTEIHLLVLTDGSKGTWDTQQDLAALVRTRRAEARDAARALGNGIVHFGDFVDGELESDLAGRRAVCRTIREVRPRVVIGHDPWKRYRLHPDHRHAGWITVDGLVAARDPHFFPGVGGAHHRPDLLMLFEADDADHIESIEDSIATKVAALLCHRSQWRSTMNIDPDAADVAAQHEAFSVRVADRARVGESRQLGESFRLLRDL
ncbi:MAG: PIG-L family deacetylase [Acidimicrobiia bacterium]|nr:PIG-L family deacetylase [Acidimicrobiia bacterium]